MYCLLNLVKIAYMEHEAFFILTFWVGFVLTQIFLAKIKFLVYFAVKYKQ